MFTKQAARRRHRSCAPDGRHRSGVYRDVMDDVETSSVQSRRRSRSSTRTSDRLQKEPEDVPPQPVEVVLARLLTDTLASLTRSFEKGALSSGEVSFWESSVSSVRVRLTAKHVYSNYPHGCS